MLWADAKHKYNRMKSTEGRAPLCGTLLKPAIVPEEGKLAFIWFWKIYAGLQSYLSELLDQTLKKE